MVPLNVRDLLIARVGVPVVARQTAELIASGVDGFQIIQGVPNRIGLAIVNGGTGVMFARPLVAPGAGLGFRVEPGGGALLVSWEEDGEVVAWPWFGVTSAGTTLLYRLEILIEAHREAAPGGGR